MKILKYLPKLYFLNFLFTLVLTYMAIMGGDIIWAAVLSFFSGVNLSYCIFNILFKSYIEYIQERRK